MVTAIRNIQTSPDITNANAKEVRTIAAPRKPTNIYKARNRQGDRKREYANVSDITKADAKAPTKHQARRTHMIAQGISWGIVKHRITSRPDRSTRNRNTRQGRIAAVKLQGSNATSITSANALIDGEGTGTIADQR